MIKNMENFYSQYAASYSFVLMMHFRAISGMKMHLINSWRSLLKVIYESFFYFVRQF